MADRVIQRNDTAARWQQFNPVLAAGEIGIVTDGAKGYKIGDGVTAWNNLPYPANPASIVQEKGTNVNAVMSQDAVTRELTELESKISIKVADYTPENTWTNISLIVNNTYTIYINVVSAGYYQIVYNYAGTSTGATYILGSATTGIYLEPGNYRYTFNVTSDFGALKVATGGGDYSGIGRVVIYDVQSRISDEISRIEKDIENVTNACNQNTEDIEILNNAGTTNIFNINDTANIRLGIATSPSGYTTSNANYADVVLKINSKESILSVNHPVYSICFLAEYTDGDIQNIVPPTNISRIEGGNTNENVSIPNNAKYALISLESKHLSSLMVTYTSKAQEYEAYEDLSTAISNIKASLKDYIDVNIADYDNNLRNVFAAINPSKSRWYRVLIPEGVYNIDTWFTSEEKAADGFIGLMLPNYVKLEGKGDRENIILQWNSDTTQYFISTLNWEYAVEMENLTVKSSNIRYTIHDDFAFDSRIESYRHIKNCDFMHFNGAFGACLGGGHHGNFKATFENCSFYTDKASGTTVSQALSYHNNRNSLYEAYITFDNCRFKNSMSGACVTFFSQTTEGDNGQTSKMTYVTMKGCKGSTFVSLEEQGGEHIGCLCKLTGYANKFASPPTIVASDGVDYSSYIDLI